jgi:hypothetical protein
VARNVVVNSNFALTVESSANLLIYNNFFDGADATNYVIASWGGMYGTSIIANNTIINSENHYALTLGDTSEQRSFICVNNIIDGSGAQRTIRRNNLFVGIAWDMTSSNGWTPGEDEIVDIDKRTGSYVAIPAAEVFLEGRPGVLRRGSRCIGAGLDFRRYFDSLSAADTNLTRLHTLTNDFAWRTTLGNIPRPEEGKWDIGAFQFDSAAQTVKKLFTRRRADGAGTIELQGTTLTISTIERVTCRVSIFSLNGCIVHTSVVSARENDLSRFFPAGGVYLIRAQPMSGALRPAVFRCIVAGKSRC